MFVIFVTHFINLKQCLKMSLSGMCHKVMSHWFRPHPLLVM